MIDKNHPDGREGDPLSKREQLLSELVDAPYQQEDWAKQQRILKGKLYVEEIIRNNDGRTPWWMRVLASAIFLARLCWFPVQLLWLALVRILGYQTAMLAKSLVGVLLGVIGIVVYSTWPVLLLGTINLLWLKLTWWLMGPLMVLAGIIWFVRSLRH